MVPEVFVASVHWRRPALEALLISLDAQTMPPRRTTLILEDAEKHLRVDELRYLADVTVFNRGRVGPGVRWILASERPRDTLALIIDDDIAVDNKYIERTMAAYERLAGPLSWNGMNFLDAYIRPEESTQDVRLLTMGAGTAAVPAWMLRDIGKDPMAPQLFGVHGDDEALVSWWLARQHGQRLWRPAGPSGAYSTEFQSDPRSQWSEAGGRHFGFREMLRRRGWPLIDPPHEFTRRQRFRGTAEPAPARGPRLMPR